MSENTKKTKKWWQGTIPYIVALAIFAVLTVTYFSPILSGKVLHAGDTKNWECMYQSNKEYQEKTHENSWWSDSMFGGMPAYQIGGGVYPGSELCIPFSKISRIGFTGTMAIMIGYLIGFFILFRAFKVNVWVSIIGSIAVTFSSYFFIIIAAGHVTKAVTIGLFAPVIAGFYLIFQKKYWLGALLTMVYTSLTFFIHPQMSYYFCMMIGVFVIAEIYIHSKENRWKDLGIAIGVFVASMLVGLGTSFPRYAANQEYVKETMRGGHSELVKESDAQNKTEGLDLDYATAWSYGIDESFTFLIPGFKGDASDMNVGKKSEVYKSLINQGVPASSAAEFCKQVPTYWGTQPFTSGPVYMGAIICFLFVLGLMIVEGPYKWALLACTIFSILLSWGNNFMGLTEFFFKYFPMYNKFRAVSSILVVAEVAMPLLAILGIKTIMDKEIDKNTLLKKCYISGGITAGLCLFFALFGSVIYDFQSPNDTQTLSQLPQWLNESIVDQRTAMFKSDSWRSFFFIVAAVVLLVAYAKNKLKLSWSIAAIGVLILADMWSVDKRYLNDDCFVSPRSDKNYFKKKAWEEALLNSEKDLNYRVLNLTTNTFNEARTSYYFKSIGGYHAAKLRRYQDLIEQHISIFNMQVLDMLNTKYFIVKGQDGQPMIQKNPTAMGNAWFVDSVTVVSTPNEESDALKTINIHNSAVTDAKFASFVSSFQPQHDSTANVKLVSYTPNKLKYESSADKSGIVVFSEIYYPYGWKATIDGVPAEHFRANYLLRALNVPAGMHTIEFVFDPECINSGAPIAYTSFFIIYLLLFGGLGWMIYRKFIKKDRLLKE